MFGSKQLCPDCTPRVLGPVRIWTPAFLTVIGTIFPPTALVLVMVDWWRLGSAGRMLIPVGALVARFAANIGLRILVLTLSLPPIPSVPSYVIPFALNLLSMLLGTQGLWARSRTHLENGGGRASVVMGIAGAIVIPGCFFTAFYTLFAGGSR